MADYGYLMFVDGKLDLSNITLPTDGSYYEFSNKRIGGIALPDDAIFYKPDKTLFTWSGTSTVRFQYYGRYEDGYVIQNLNSFTDDQDYILWEWTGSSFKYWLMEKFTVKTILSKSGVVKTGEAANLNDTNHSTLQASAPYFQIGLLPKGKNPVILDNIGTTKMQFAGASGYEKNNNGFFLLYSGTLSPSGVWSLTGLSDGNKGIYEMDIGETYSSTKVGAISISTTYNQHTALNSLLLTNDDYTTISSTRSISAYNVVWDFVPITDTKYNQSSGKVIWGKTKWNDQKVIEGMKGKISYNYLHQSNNYPIGREGGFYTDIDLDSSSQLNFDQEYKNLILTSETYLLSRINFQWGIVHPQNNEKIVFSPEDTIINYQTKSTSNVPSCFSIFTSGAEVIVNPNQFFSGTSNPYERFLYFSNNYVEDTEPFVYTGNKRNNSTDANNIVNISGGGTYVYEPPRIYDRSFTGFELETIPALGSQANYSLINTTHGDSEYEVCVNVTRGSWYDTPNSTYVQFPKEENVRFVFYDRAGNEVHSIAATPRGTYTITGPDNFIEDSNRYSVTINSSVMATAYPLFTKYGASFARGHFKYDKYSRVWNGSSYDIVSSNVNDMGVYENAGTAICNYIIHKLPTNTCYYPWDVQNGKFVPGKMPQEVIDLQTSDWQELSFTPVVGTTTATALTTTYSNYTVRLDSTKFWTLDATDKFFQEYYNPPSTTKAALPLQHFTLQVTTDDGYVLIQNGGYWQKDVFAPKYLSNQQHLGGGNWKHTITTNLSYRPANSKFVYFTIVHRSAYHSERWSYPYVDPNWFIKRHLVEVWKLDLSNGNITQVS